MFNLTRYCPSIKQTSEKNKIKERMNNNYNNPLKIKSMKKMMMSLLAVVIGMSTANADNKRAISTCQLPQTAQTFLTKHFKGDKIAMTTTERDWLSKEYNVVFVNGTKIEFDSNGNWENIDCKQGYVPEDAIPAPIAKYLNETFPGSRVVEIDVDSRDYEVELSNGMELKFDKNFNVFKIKK